MVESPDIFFTIKDIVYFVTIAFFLGGLAIKVTTNARDIRTGFEAMVKRQDTLEEKFLNAIENFGEKVGELSNELKALLALHETRITVLEKKAEHDERKDHN